MRHQGLLYRALNPVYAAEPLSGRGAELYGGRFNAKGMPALYTSLSVLTAIREANQVGHLQPTTLVAYDADIDKVFDGTDAAALAAHAMTPEALASGAWRDEMRRTGLSATQAFSQKLSDAGFHGILAPSYAKGAGPADLNLVLWSWEGMLSVIDDEKRLERARLSRF